MITIGGVPGTGADHPGRAVAGEATVRTAAHDERAHCRTDRTVTLRGRDEEIRT